jgi:mRNA interferase MazF
MFKKGEIYLARLNPRKGNEVGKLRPVLIFQTNMLNDIEHPTTVIIPLSTHLINNAYPLRYRVSKREGLEQDSDLLCDQIRAIDNGRIISKSLAKLSLQELLEVDEQVKIVLE